MLSGITTNPRYSSFLLRPEQLVSSGLIARSHAQSHQFLLNQPFPYIVIDNFLDGEIAGKVAGEVDSLPDKDYRVSFRGPTQRKLQLGNIQGMVPTIYPLYDALMGPSFTGFVEIVSAYANLEADRQFTGAGLQRYHRDGFSEIHLDSNRHPFDSDLHHRVNLLIFLNPAWQSEWGGELVLWSSRNSRPDRPAVTIQPKFNRAVFFAVTRRSWHSVNRVRCPGDRHRNSIAIYYFNRIPAEEDEKPRSVIWHSTHGWPRQVVFEVTNRVMTIAKPYAPYLRWLRPDKFDGVRPS